MDYSTTAIILATVVGVPLTSLIKHPEWRQELNYLISLFVVSALAAFGIWIDGGFAGGSAAGNIGIAIAVSQTVYNTVMTGAVKPLANVNDVLTSAFTKYKPEDLEE